MENYKIVIVSKGTFRLSELAREYLINHGIREKYPELGWSKSAPHLSVGFISIPRHDPLLVQCIEELGSSSEPTDGRLRTYLRVIEIPSSKYLIVSNGAWGETVYTDKDFIQIPSHDH